MRHADRQLQQPCGVPKELLKTRIAEKNRRIADYRLVAPEVWLLIVNDQFLGPGDVYARPGKTACPRSEPGLVKFLDVAVPLFRKILGLLLPLLPMAAGELLRGPEAVKLCGLLEG